MASLEPCGFFIQESSLANGVCWNIRTISRYSKSFWILYVFLTVNLSTGAVLNISRFFIRDSAPARLRHQADHQHRHEAGEQLLLISDTILYYIILYYIILYYIILYYITLSYIILHYIILHYTRLYYIILYYIILYYIMLCCPRQLTRMSSQFC